MRSYGFMLCGRFYISQNGGVELRLNRPLSSRQVKKEKLRHKGLVSVSKGSQTL